MATETRLWPIIFDWNDFCVTGGDTGDCADVDVTMRLMLLLLLLLL